VISYTVGGSTKRTEDFLNKMIKGDLYSGLEQLAQQGVDALRAATREKRGLRLNPGPTRS
jgi:hypothetical protein